MVRSDSYFGGRTTTLIPATALISFFLAETSATLARCSWRVTRRVRARKSMSPTWTSSASPRRSPAKAHNATNAVKPGRDFGRRPGSAASNARGRQGGDMTRVWGWCGAERFWLRDLEEFELVFEWAELVVDDIEDQVGVDAEELVYDDVA